RLAAADRRRVMNADSAVDLIMQPDLAIQLVLVPRELDTVHPEIRVRQAWPVGVLGINLWQRDERPAIIRPRLDQGQTVDVRRMIEDRSSRYGSRKQVPGGCRDPSVSPGVLDQLDRADLELDQPAHGVERVAEQKTRSV